MLDLPGVTSSSTAQLSESLHRVHDQLRLRVELGQTLEQAIDATFGESPQYHSALRTFLDTQQPELSFNRLIPESQSRSSSDARSYAACLRLAALLTLAAAVFIGFCWFTVPKIAGLSEQVWQKPHAIIVALLQLRESLPLLILSSLAVTGLLIASAYWIWLRGMSTRGESTSHRYIRKAHTARTIATLTRGHVPLEQALALAAPTLASEVSSQPQRSPSLLEWAARTTDSSESASHIFQTVSDVYRRFAIVEESTWRHFLPSLMTIVIGGIVVLLMGLALFLPFVDLLNDVSLAGAPK